MGRFGSDIVIPPIIGISAYPGGTWVIRRVGMKGRQPPPGQRGNTIERLSHRSRARLLMLATETKVQFQSMMTLTYGAEFPYEGKRVKKDLNRFLTWVRRRLKCEYLWFLEFQKRGAPHIHILLSTERIDRYEFAKAWCEIASDNPEERIKIFKVHAHPDQWQAVRKNNGLVRYVAKYATKCRQKTVPKEYQNVGRFWGASREVKDSMPEPVDVQVSEWALREHLDNLEHRCADWEVLPLIIFGV